MSQTVVQKYGGSSLAGVERIRQVALRVKARRDEGHRLVVVVSAMGDTTDELLGLAKQISADPPRRELDMLLTCGERISMALLSMALQELGVAAISFTGSQSGIITDDTHAQARIIEVRPDRIERALAEAKVVIVAGYQGVSRGREVTTLGRGGSDTSAVALAAALGADCEIFSDVDGVFTADPRVVPSARKLEAVSFDEMRELAAAGARVLNAQAVELAQQRGIVIHAGSTHSPGSGTFIRVSAPPARLRGITCDERLWVLSTSKGASFAIDALEPLEVRPRIVLASSVGQTLVIVPLEDVHSPETARAKLPPEIEVLDGLATVTCVGTSLGSDWAVAREAYALASALGGGVVASYASTLQLTLLVNRALAKPLTRALHEALIG